MNTIRAILPYFRVQKSGTILNVSSGAGKFTLPTISMYAASKFALEGFSEALSFELAALNIRVKIVEPGGTHTNFNAVSAEGFAFQEALSDYLPFMAAVGKMFSEMATTSVTAEEVAAVIYGAVTDGTDTLRYPIGNADFMSRLAARQELLDQEYIDAIKKGFSEHLN